eukprot:3138334-Amphidinium_carterae.1
MDATDDMARAAPHLQTIITINVSMRRRVRDYEKYSAQMGDLAWEATHSECLGKGPEQVDTVFAQPAPMDLR